MFIYFYYLQLIENGGNSSFYRIFIIDYVKTAAKLQKIFVTAKEKAQNIVL